MVYSILHVRRYPWLDKQLCIQWFDWQISFPKALMVSKENVSASDYSLATLSHCCVCKDSDFVQSWAYHMKPWNNFPGNWKLDSFPLCQSFLKQIFTRGCAQRIATLPFAVSVFWVLVWPSLCWCFSDYNCGLEQQIQEKKRLKWIQDILYKREEESDSYVLTWTYFTYSTMSPLGDFCLCLFRLFLSLNTIKILFYLPHDSLETVIPEILKDSSLAELSSEKWFLTLQHINIRFPHTAKKKKNSFATR